MSPIIEKYSKYKLSVSDGDKSQTLHYGCLDIRFLPDYHGQKNPR